ncbi:MAG TPA: type II toxin-antitoxin system VapC family toxin [Anaeromyxobacteraceae bacterium]|nr:type II toxin-antitoxin system VapC family toxin [Anaeromyxobacteraceae bacterium]
MIAYLDSSVVLRIVLGQPGALGGWREVERGVTSELARLECLRTIDRLRLRHRLPAADVSAYLEELEATMAEIDLVELTRDVLRRAAEPVGAPLGTLDALHLATALLWRERNGPLDAFATHDAELGRAARACGFDVLGR